MSDFDEIFKKYNIVQDKMKTLFTIVVYNMCQQDLIDQIDHRLKLVNNIKYAKKRICVCNRLYNLKTHIKDNSINNSVKNCIFLVADDVNEINLCKEWINVLKYFSVDNFIFRYDDKFDISYLKSLLTDTSYKDVIHVKNNTMKHIHINPTKKRIHYKLESKSLDIDQYIKDNIINTCIIHGVSSVLKNLKSDRYQIFTRNLTDEEIYNIFKKDEIISIHKQLQEYMTYITNEKLTHRIVFGKDIEKKIITRELKIIFCSQDIYTKIKIKIPSEYLNFDLILVDTLEKGDIGDKLKIQYNGALGVTYY